MFPPLKGYGAAARLMHPGDSVVGHPGDLGELFLGVNLLNNRVRILT